MARPVRLTCSPVFKANSRLSALVARCNSHAQRATHHLPHCSTTRQEQAVDIQVTASDVLERIPGLDDAHARQLADAATLLTFDYLDRCAAREPFTSTQTAAIRGAILTQCDYWHANTITPFSEDTKTSSNVVQSVSLMSASTTFAGASEALAARNTAATELCRPALIILRLAGLRPSQPIVIG